MAKIRFEKIQHRFIPWRKFEWKKMAYPVASPIEHLVWASVVRDGVRVTCWDVCHSRQAFDSNGRVFRACPAKSSFVIATPGEYGPIWGQSDGVHSPANYFNYRSSRERVWNGENLRLPWFLDFKRSVITETYIWKTWSKNSSKSWNSPNCSHSPDPKTYTSVIFFFYF